MDYKEALKELENGNIKECIDFFKENNHLLEYGYCLLLTDKLDDADFIFKKLKSTRADWGTKLITIMRGYIHKFPTYFQIRSFLEIDMTLLFKSSLEGYVQRILDASESLQNINNETYKFIARALLKNGYIDMCKSFLDKSLDNYYRDPELHFLYVEYYLEHNDKQNAQRAVENCLRIDPNYFPAKKMKKELVSSIS